MGKSNLRLIKRCTEFESKERVDCVPPNRRGLYVLYRLKEIDGNKHYDVVYLKRSIGSRSAMRSLDAFLGVRSVG